MRLWKTSPPMVLRLRPAPITATERGASMPRTAVIAAIGSRASKRDRASGVNAGGVWGGGVMSARPARPGSLLLCAPRPLLFKPLEHSAVVGHDVGLED